MPRSGALRSSRTSRPPRNPFRRRTARGARPRGSCRGIRARRVPGRRGRRCRSGARGSSRPRGSTRKIARRRATVARPRPACPPRARAGRSADSLPRGRGCCCSEAPSAGRGPPRRGRRRSPRARRPASRPRPSGRPRRASREARGRSRSGAPPRGRRRSSGPGTKRPSPDFSVPTQSSGDPVPSSTARRTDGVLGAEGRSGVDRAPAAAVEAEEPRPDDAGPDLPAAALRPERGQRPDLRGREPLLGAVCLDPAVLEDRRAGVRPDPDRLASSRGGSPRESSTPGLPAARKRGPSAAQVVSWTLRSPETRVPTQSVSASTPTPPASV